ncbi:MAG TPA: hypothetical protein VGO53_16375 [Steroidobacteraceae bacterium]|jgi:hypothetical protein|nr:hypothetical protein [Steroidobacteraceae bacterium]
MAKLVPVSERNHALAHASVPPCAHADALIIGRDATVFIAAPDATRVIALKGCTLSWCTQCGATRCNNGRWAAPGTEIDSVSPAGDGAAHA